MCFGPHYHYPITQFRTYSSGSVQLHFFFNIVTCGTTLSSDLLRTLVSERSVNLLFVNEVVDAIREEKIGRLEWTRNYKTHDSGKRKKSAKMSLFRL